MKKNFVTLIVTAFFTTGVLVGCGSQQDTVVSETTTEYGTEDTSIVEAIVESSTEVVEESTDVTEEEPKTETKWVVSREYHFIDEKSEADYNGDYDVILYITNYDDSGNKVEQRTYHFGWNLDNEEDTIEDMVASIDYDYAEGNLEDFLESACTYEYDDDFVKAIYENGYVSTYDKYGNWISQIDNSGNESILYEYEYDHNGNVVKRTDVGANMGDTTYEYDENNNLVTEYRNDNIYTYEYDEHNNKVSMSRTKDGVTEVLHTYDNEYDDSNNLIKVAYTIGQNPAATVYTYETIEVPLE